jgi:hypothetical protein
MRVEMTTHISGTRNGEEWPAPGAVLDLPDHEAESLIVAGYAKEATDAPTPDPATVPVVEEDGDEPAPAEDGDGEPEAEPVSPVAKPARARKSTKG